MNWSLSLSAKASSSSVAAVSYLAGPPMGFVDASHTLSLTAITILDMQGNSLTNSGLKSYAGFDYSQSNSAATPEPATAELCGGIPL